MASSVDLGSAVTPLLGERYYPFQKLEVTLDSGVTVSSAAYQVSGVGAWTAVSAGSWPDIRTACKFKAFVASAFASAKSYDLKVDFSDTNSGLASATTPIELRIARDKTVKQNRRVRMFADSRFAVDATYISAVQYAISGITTGASSVAKTTIPRVVITSGTHNTGTSISLIDTTKNFLQLGVRNNDIVEVSTGASMIVTGIASTVSANDTLSGSLSSGSFTAGAAYDIRDGENLILLAGNAEYLFAATGTHKCILYVTDSSSTEDEDYCFVRVE